MKLDTVRIVADEVPGGVMVINRSDFDEKRHRLWPDAAVEAGETDIPVKGDERGAGETKKPETPEVPGLDEMSVPELREYAKAHGLDVPAGATTKAAILAALRAAESDRK